MVEACWFDCPVLSVDLSPISLHFEVYSLIVEDW
jgi:hypothetical protein